MITAHPRIYVNGGLVDSQDPSNLKEGELTRADDCYYKVSDPALWKVRGRAAYNSTPESAPIQGAGFIGFDDGTQKLVVMTDGSYKTGPADDTGSFTTIESGLSSSATSLDVVMIQNRAVLLNGVDRGRVVEPDGTTRLLGMLYNTEPPSYRLLEAGPGNGLTIGADKKLVYWVQEIARTADGLTVIKRNGETGATVLTVPGPITNAYVEVTRPAQKNPDATQWALFCSPTLDINATPTLLGAQVGIASINTTSIIDGRTATNPELPPGPIYATYAATFFGISQLVALWGEPPIASTGAAFLDSLVLNNKAKPRQIVWSSPNSPDGLPLHAFPAFNVDDIPAGADEVRAVRTLGRMLITLFRDSAWRHDTLPRSSDADFNSGSVREQIDGAFGTVGVNANALFSTGDGLLLVYASPSGLSTTDGVSWGVISGDLEWERAWNAAALARMAIVNNPMQYRLELDGPGAAETQNSKAYFLHYHPSHRKEGVALKLTGPITRRARCTARASVNGLPVIFSGHTDGRLYREDVGATDASGGTLSMVVRTGDIATAGWGYVHRLKSLYAHHQAAPERKANIKIVQRTEGNEDNTITRIIGLGLREHTHVGAGDALAEAFQFGFENADGLGQVALDYFVPVLSEASESLAKGGGR